MPLAQRSQESEWMDTLTVTEEEFADCLRDLESINHWTLAYRPTLRWLKAQLQHHSNAVSVMDIGSGGGDMLRKIWRRFGQRQPLHLQGVDMNPWSKAVALTRSPGDMPVRYETADIFALPLERRADYIVSSLFTHHLDNEEIIRFLSWMETHAEAGWFINDLHRHVVPYHFIRHATHWLGYNRLVQHDAPISVARAFTRDDWQALLAAANIPAHEVVIRWHFPFRYCIGRRK